MQNRRLGSRRVREWEKARSAGKTNKIEQNSVTAKGLRIGLGM